jgi:hypothetical protein
MTPDSAEHPVDYLAQLLEPVGACFTPEVAERVANLRASPQVQARIDELAEKNTEGEITEEELAEYDSYIHAIDFIAILQAQARQVLARTGKA